MEQNDCIDIVTKKVYEIARHEWNSLSSVMSSKYCEQIGIYLGTTDFATSEQTTLTEHKSLRYVDASICFIFNDA